MAQLSLAKKKGFNAVACEWLTHSTAENIRAQLQT